MTKYSTEVEKVFQTIESPYVGFVVDLVEHSTFLELRIYEPNVNQFNQKQKIEIAQYLFSLRDAITATGIQCEILGVQNTPPNQVVIRKARENLKRSREVNGAL